MGITGRAHMGRPPFLYIFLCLTSLFLTSCALPFRIIDATKVPVYVDHRRGDVAEATEQALSDLSRQELQAILYHNAPPLSHDSPHFKKISALVQAIKDMFSLPSLALQDGVQLYIVPADEPIATTLYPNILLLSTSITNPSSPCGVDDEAALIGVLSHEIAHIQLNHTRYKGINAAYANDVLKNTIGYGTFNAFTRMLPFSPRVIMRRESLSDVAFAEWYFESVADLLAMQVVKTFGYEPASYVDYVYKIYKNADSGYCAYAESNAARDNRLGRLAAYVSDAPYHKPPCHVARFIQYDYGDVPHVFMFTTDITVSRETANRILYWQYATSHNEEWCGEFMCFSPDRLEKTGFRPDIIEKFSEYRVISLPISISGFDSLLFDAEPTLLEQLEEVENTQGISFPPCNSGFDSLLSDAERKVREEIRKLKEEQ